MTKPRRSHETDVSKNSESDLPEEGYCVVTNRIRSVGSAAAICMQTMVAESSEGSTLEAASAECSGLRAFKNSEGSPGYRGGM